MKLFLLLELFYYLYNIYCIDVPVIRRVVTHVVIADVLSGVHL